jgi:hypothetical protein
LKGAPTRGNDAPKLFGFRFGFEIEVMLADDALGIAGLEGGIAYGFEGPDRHRNECVAKDIVHEAETLPNDTTMVLEAVGYYRVLIERILLEPQAKIGLDLDGTLFVDLGDFGIDEDNVRVEAYVAIG